MLRRVRDLSPEQRGVVESLLGRAIAEDEAVIIKTVRPAAILPPDLSPDERREALTKLEQYFARVDSKRRPVSEEEEEAILNEALRSTRPNYRPVR